MAHVHYFKQVPNIAPQGQWMFDELCGQLTTMGYTLHDDISSSLKVFKTQGESGTEIPVYLKVSVISYNCYVQVFLYWDASTHVGSLSATQIYQGSTLNYMDGYFFLLGDKTGFLWGTRRLIYTDSMTGNLFSYIDAPGSFKTTTTASIEAGSTVSIPVSDSSKFKGGQTIQILGQNYEGIYNLQVVNVLPSIVVVSSVPKAFASGAYIGMYPILYSSLYRSTSGECVGSTFKEGTPTTAQTVGMVAYDRTAAQVDPAADGRVYIGSSYLPLLEYPVLSLPQQPVGSQLKNNPVTYNLGIYSAFNTPVTGHQTSSDSLSVTDSSKTWTVNEFVGKRCVIVSGDGVGQTRKIISNTSTTLTFAFPFGEPLTSTSAFQIVDRTFYAGTGSFFIEEDY